MELEDERIWTQLNIDRDQLTDLPWSYLWAISKYDYIDIIFSQGRYEEAATAIQNSKVECEQLGDTYFTRLYYQILSMIKAHQGSIDESIKMFNGVKAYAQKLGHDDLKLAEYFGNMGEFLYYHARPEKWVDIFKESRVLFWVNLQRRGLKIIDVTEHIDLKTGSIKNKRIPDSEQKKDEQKAPVEEKKDPKQKGKPDAKAEPVAEEDYSKIDRVIKYDKEMNFEIFELYESFEPWTLGTFGIFGVDSLVKSNLRYAEALWVVDTKYDLSAKVISETLRIIEKWIYTNPYHKYTAHFLYGYCHKMLFLTKIQDYQRKYASSTDRKYRKFVEGLPSKGLAPARLFYLLPNYSNHIRNGWKELLMTAKEHLEKSIKIAKSEWVFGEFGIDTADSAFNLAEVCYLLAEYRESARKYVYLKDKEVYKQHSRLDTNKNAEADPEDLYDKWLLAQAKQDRLDTVMLRKQARLYLKLGGDISRARSELADNYFIIIQTNLTDPSKIPKEFMNDLLQTQAIQTSAFLESVNETMEPDLWKALKSKVKNSVNSGETISIFKSLIAELLYFTYGAEK